MPPEAAPESNPPSPEPVPSKIGVNNKNDLAVKPNREHRPIPVTDMISGQQNSFLVRKITLNPWSEKQPQGSPQNAHRKTWMKHTSPYRH